MPIEIGTLLYPRLTQLDLTGPFEVFTRIPGARVHLLWKSLEPVTADSGLRLLPTRTLDRCPALDVLMVPGGPGQVDLMDDLEVLGFLRDQGQRARFVTSVCTGSLVLAAAGLLDGYCAACHWQSRDQLAAFGVQASAERVVVDRNRVTGGGITAGIDFGLRLAAILAGEDQASLIQLQMEYDPQPPFDCGSPEAAGGTLVEEARRRGSELRKRRTAATERVLARRQA